MNLIANKLGGPLNPGMEDDESRAERLIRLRRYLGHDTQIEMARAVKTSGTTWNNYEKGFPLPIGAAMKVRRAVPGLTLDWIYYGDPSKLSLELAQALGELPAGTVTPSTATKAGRRG